MLHADFNTQISPLTYEHLRSLSHSPCGGAAAFFLPKLLDMPQIFIAAVDSSGNYVVPDEPLAWSSPGATLGVKFDMAGSLYICNAPLGLLQVGGSSISGIGLSSCLERQLREGSCLRTPLRCVLLQTAQHKAYVMGRRESRD
jgi:hypothetical protein